jgi:tetratricopeptide (TPR) repeat protein
VDNAADVSGAVLDSMSRLRDAPAPALFVLGERLNEWRVGKGRLHAQEHLIEPLSDPEINRLLDFLEKHGELNSLEPLSPELRFAAVKKIHQKELLVAMREATEDNTFDAILEDEFLSLASEIAKRVYLIVCCFYQHGALLRDSLLSDLVGLPLAELHAFTGDATEGVVVYEELDPIQGTWVVRARHRTIAKIVWERCGDILHKEALIVQCLSALNLNHYTDANAFEQFIRSDNFIDGIRTLEGKTRFFDKAIEKDPDSPYVRQHYARMLTRVDRPELALSQIQKGLELDSSIKVLYHTQGVILSRLAIASPSLDIARRRMVQAENAFRRGINIYAKDEYSYASLAELYLEWATKVPAESADYVSKCEATISEALRVVSSKEHLWIVSSKVNDLLGNEPGRIGDLERAVREQTSAVYPRFLLARVYRESGEPQKAIDILDPVFREHPDEFRLSLEYARALDDLGRPYNVPLAIMSLGTLYGLRDARFIATYGGMLFMNKDFTEASKIFAETTKRDFSTFDGRAVHYRPKRKDDPTKAIRLSGRVVEIKAGYGFIEVPGYPTFYCPSSKQRGIKLQRKMTIEFEACFSARGAVADRLVDPHRGTPHKRPV